MCGIAGTLEFPESRTPGPERLDELARMACLIGHRGPDETGYFIDERAALVAVRLSITDLENGQQPVGDASQRYWIVYNGEIYNHLEIRKELEQRGHRFETRCDTEVALRAWIEWGEDAPRRFDGGYAFVLYDRLRRVAFLVRDRFGKRPLFFYFHNQTLLFGSEIKAFLARPGLTLRWDSRQLAAIFGTWTPVSSGTPFEGVRQVAPGTILRVSSAGIVERRYGSFPLPGDAADIDLVEATAGTHALLRESVRLRLRSDVEVGVLLSGGLDSTIVTHLVRTEQPRRLRSFSISFDDPQFDESCDQQRVVDAFALSHESLQISGREIPDAFQSALWHAEVPQFRTAFVPMFLLARLIRERGIKVVLSGEGADEVFLGYDILKETRLRAAWRTLGPEERRARLSRLYPYLPHFSEANLRSLEAIYARSSVATESRLFSHALRLENGRLALRLLRGEADGCDELQAAIAAVSEFDLLSSVRKAQWIEFHTLLQGYLLSSQGDRMMFAHGVEPRCPFLSPAVVSYAARMPEHHLLSADDDEKHVLKRAFREDLPPEIVAKPKRPYRAPDARSFWAIGADKRGRFTDWVEEFVSDRALREIEPLDLGAATQLLDKLRHTSRDAASPREDQAFVLLLSLSVLNRQMVQRRASLPTTHAPVARLVDLSGGACAPSAARCTPSY